MTNRPVIIGAGIGGLCAALDLAIRGYRPIVLEKGCRIGGKMDPVVVGDTEVDGGPTVLTMTWVFEELFARAGARLDDYVHLSPAKRLARHFWPDTSQLDLFSDFDRSREAIKAFAGAKEADGFVRYHQYAREIFNNVDDVFIRAPKPTPWGVMKTLGVRAIPDFSASTHAAQCGPHSPISLTMNAYDNYSVATPHMRVITPSPRQQHSTSSPMSNKLGCGEFRVE